MKEELIQRFPNIKSKLNLYKGMLAGIKVVHNSQQPETFLVNEYLLPGTGLAGIRITAADIDKAISYLPLEDQQPMRRVFEGYEKHLIEILEDRITILSWVLDEEGRGGGT